MNRSHDAPARVLVLAALLATLPCMTRVAQGAQSTPSAPRTGAHELGRERAGVWSRDATPEGWIIVETRAYQLQSRIGGETTAALGRHLEELLALYREVLPSAASSERLVVKVLADADEYAAYGKVGAEIGGYDPESGDVVVWNTRLVLGQGEPPSGLRLVQDRIHTLTFAENQAVLHLLDAATLAETPDLGAALARHCWRQYLDRRAWPKGGPTLPAWLDQGLAEHFATASGDERGRYHTGLNPARIRELGWLLLDGEAVPLAQLLRPDGTAAAFDVGPGPRAQGWALVHFLRGQQDPGWAQLVPRLLADLSRTRDFEQTAAKVCADLDLERLQSEWRAWADGLDCVDPLAELVRTFGDKLRPDQLSGDDELKQRYAWLWRRRHGPQPGGSP